MLYLNSPQLDKSLFFYKNLTLTSVVFEWSKLEDEKRKLKDLTLTSVVFE